MRVDAVVALRSFIDAFDAEGLQQVKPLIPQLLDVFFQLMQEVGTQRLSHMAYSGHIVDVTIPHGLNPKP